MPFTGTDAFITRVVPGAAVTGQGFGRTDQPNAFVNGDLFTTTNALGEYAIVLPLVALVKDNPFAEGPTTELPELYLLSAQHPSALDRGFTAVSANDVLCAPHCTARRDIQIPLVHGNAPAAPRLRLSHSPIRPLPWPSAATPPTADQVATVTLAASHPSLLPTVELRLARPDPDVVVSFVSSNVSGLEVTNTYRVTCATGRVVMLDAVAQVDGRETRLDYPIVFGPPPTSVGDPSPTPEPDDATGPKVIGTQPRADALDWDPGRPLTIEFDEPIRRAILDTPAAAVLSPAAGLQRLSLSADQRTLTIVASAMQPGTHYDLTLSATVEDLRGNAFDEGAFHIGFDTALAMHADLPDIELGGGGVIEGRYAFVLERAGAYDGALLVYDLVDPANPARVASLPVPGYPRDLALIRRYALATRPGEPAVTRDLVAIVGGKVSPGADASFDRADNPSANFIGSQYLWVVDVSAPTDPSLLASKVLSVSPSAVVSRVTWSAPDLAYLEVDADRSQLGVVNVPMFVVAEHLSSAEFAALPLVPRYCDQPDGCVHDPKCVRGVCFASIDDAQRLSGVDENGDGDYADEGDVAPVPPHPNIDGRVGLAFGGKVKAYSIDDTRQDLVDATWDPARGFVAAILSDGYALKPDGTPDPTKPLPMAYRTLAAGDVVPYLESGVPLAASATFPFPDAELVRVAPLFDLRVEVAGQLHVADVALVFARPDALYVLDITNRDDPHPLTNAGDVFDADDVIHLGVEHGAVKAAALGDDGLVHVTTTNDVVLLDPAKLGARGVSGALHPAIAGVIPGAGRGETAGASGGLRVDSLLGDNAVIQSAPRLSFVDFGDVGLVDAAHLPSGTAEREATVASLLAHMTTRTALKPARFRGTARAPSTLTPPSERAHHYVLVEAPGSVGETLALTLESLDRGGVPLTSRGEGFAPVRAITADGADAIAQAPKGCEPKPAPLVAHRLSDDPTSPSYNLYLSQPFALVYERMAAGEVAAASKEGDVARTILWSGAYVRVMLDPSVGADADDVLAPFRTTVGEAKELVPRASATARALPFDRVLGPNPKPVVGDEKVPGTAGNISAHNGQVSMSAADLALTSRRLPLVFTRSIDGQDLYDGPFGRGWDFGYNQRLVVLDEERIDGDVPLVERGGAKDLFGGARDILFHDGQGNVIVYDHFDGAGIPAEYASDPLITRAPPEGLGWSSEVADWYLPEPGVFDALVRFKSGQLARLTPDGTQYWYAPDGRLAKSYDRYTANKTLLDYDERGELVKIRDGSVTPERFIELGYYRASDDGRFRPGLDERATKPAWARKIARIRDHTGRDVLYLYDDDGRLEHVRGPDVKTVGEATVAFVGRRDTTYHWDACGQGGSITGVTDGDDTGAPMFATSVRGGEHHDVASAGTGAYGAVTIAPQYDNTAAALAGGTAATKLTTADGAKETMTFDANGLAKSSVFSGPGAPDLTSETEHDAQLRLTRLRMPRGNEIRYVYDSGPNLRSRGNVIRIERDPRGVGVANDPVLTATYAYDARYNLPSGTMTDWNASSYVVTLQDGGRSTASISYGGGTLVATSDYDDVYGQLRKTADFDGVAHETVYDHDTGYVVETRLGDASAASTPTTTYDYGSCAAGARGLPCRITPPAGSAPTERTYDETDLLVRETRGGRDRVMSYDRNGRPVLISVEVADGRALTVRRRYDQTGFLLEDTREGIESEGGPASLTTTYTPDALERVLSITSPSGLVEQHEYDHMGRLVRLARGPGGAIAAATQTIETYGYDANGNRTAVTFGGTTEVTAWDGYDRPVTVTDALGQRMTKTYFGDGATKSMAVLDAQGAVVSAAESDIDPIGRAKNARRQMSDGAWSETAFERHIVGGPLERAEVGPRGARRVERYDSAGRDVAMTLAGVVAAMFDVDDAFRVRGVVSHEGDDPASAALDVGMSATFDGLDHTRTVRDALGVVRATLSPRLDGAVEATEDGEGDVVETPHTLLGEPFERRLPSGVVFRQRLDGDRRMAFTGDGADAGLRVTYDARGRLATSLQRDGEPTTFGDFDPRERPRAVTMPGGGATYGYDVLGRLVTADVTFGATTRHETYDWDALGRPTVDTFPDGVDAGRHERRYDRIGSMVGETFAQDGLTYVVASALYVDGTRKSVTYPSGTVVDEERDANGRLVGLDADGWSIVRSTSFATASLPGTWIAGPGILVQQRTDERRRVIAKRYEIAGKVLADVRYAWDDADRLVARQYLDRAGKTDVFAYDGAGRLVSGRNGLRAGSGSVFAHVPGLWSDAAYTRTYGYDGDGLDLLVSAAEVRAPGVTPTPFAANRGAPDTMLVQGVVDGFTRTRDARGDVTDTMVFPRDAGEEAPSPGVPAHLTYDGRGHLIEVARADGVTVTYRYRNDGLLFAREVMCTTGCTPSATGFVHDGMRLIEEHDLAAAGHPVRKRYYYADEGDVPVAAELWNGSAMKRYLYLTDVIGDVMAMTDEAGTVVERVCYDAWGEPTVERPDTTPPAVARVVVDAPDTIMVVFSEPVNAPIDATSTDRIQGGVVGLAGAFTLTGPGDTPHSINGVTIVSDARFGWDRAVKISGIDPPLADQQSYTLTLAQNRFVDGASSLNSGQTMTMTLAGYVGVSDDTDAETVATSAIGSPFLFQGEWFDDATGLLYLRARWYDPYVGAFLSPDPEAYGDSVNPYAGFAHRPTFARDPTGNGALTEAEEIAAALKQGIGGGRGMVATGRGAHEAEEITAAVKQGIGAARRVASTPRTKIVKAAETAVLEESAVTQVIKTEVGRREVILVAGRDVMAMAERVAAERGADIINLQNLTAAEREFLQSGKFARVTVMGHGVRLRGYGYVGVMNTHRGWKDGEEVANWLTKELGIEAEEWDLLSCGSGVEPKLGSSFAQAFYEGVGKQRVVAYRSTVLVDKEGRLSGAVFDAQGNHVGTGKFGWRVKRRFDDPDVTLEMEWRQRRLSIPGDFIRFVVGELQ